MSTNFANQNLTAKSSGFLGLFSNKNQSLAPQTEDRKIMETIDLLKRAQKTIEKAERVITEQTKHIQSLETVNMLDELTGLLSYRGFQQAFQRERSRLQRENGRNGMITLIEIENFDHVRAKHGKATSEACLKMVAKLLRNEIRDMDSVGRIRGDEFALLFAGATTDVALERTQRLALKINSLSLAKGEENIQISASIRLQDFGPETEFSTFF